MRKARNIEQRSRILFTHERVDVLCRQIANDPLTGARWERFLAKGEQVLEMAWMKEAAVERGDGQHGNTIMAADQLLKAIQHLGLIYAVTGDKRCAAKIRESLIHFSGFQHWCGPGFQQRTPPWKSELATATCCLAFAQGISLLGNELAGADRKLIVSALVEKGIQPILQDWLLPGTRIHALDSMGHNWWMVCLSLAGVGAVVLCGEHPEAEAWLDAIDRSVPLWFDYRGNVLQNKVANFDAAGAFYESVGYANYALSEYLLYRMAVTDACPGRQPTGHPVLGLVEQFFLHTLYPVRGGALVVNFGDHDITAGATKAMRLLAASGLTAPHGEWYVQRTEQEPDSPFALLMDPPATSLSSPPDSPVSKLFHGAGWGVMRSSWVDDATLLAMHSGIFWNHAHADSGSFVLFHRGQPLIIDSGKCPYWRPEYIGYYITSRAHNVVLVNGQGAPADDFQRGSKFSGSLHSLLDDGGLKYVYADATGPMAHKLARHYRHWIWADGVIVIFDDLLAHEPSCFNWLLHYGGTAIVDGTTVSLKNGAAEAHVRMLYPEALNLSQPLAPAPDCPDQQAAYLEFSTTDAARQQNFMASVIPVDRGEEPPQVDLLQAQDLLGVRIKTTVTVTDVYFNLLADGRRMHENSNGEMGGWATDAYLLAVTRPLEAAPDNLDGVSRLLVVGGSYVRRHGVTLMESLSKVDALVVFHPGSTRMTLCGQPMVNLGLRRANCPGKVQINGCVYPISFTEAEMIYFSITT